MSQVFEDTFPSFITFQLPWHRVQGNFSENSFPSISRHFFTSIFVRPPLLVFHVFLLLNLFSHLVGEQPLVAVKKGVVGVKFFKILPLWNILFYSPGNCIKANIRHNFPFVFCRLHCLHLSSINIIFGNLIICTEVRMMIIITAETQDYYEDLINYFLIKHLEQYLA